MTCLSQCKAALVLFIAPTKLLPLILHLPRKAAAGCHYLGRLTVPLQNALLYEFNQWRDVVELGLLQNTLIKQNISIQH